MRRLLIFLLLVSCSNPSWSLQGNLTMPKNPIELSITSEDDSERELSSQLEEVDSRSGGWSSWSEWSACSRSCDGGASHQLRTCKSGSCRGEHVRYQICNMQALVAFFAVFAAANAGLLAPAAKILQGPSSRTTLVGPEGSVISSVAPGGQVITESLPGAVAYSAPVVAAPAVAAYSAPVVSAYSAPVVSAYSAPVVSAYSTPVVSAYSAYASPVLAGGLVGEQTVVAGPSGTIATGKSFATPAVAAYTAPIW